MQEATILQSSSLVWHEQRKPRIGASIVGDIIKRRKNEATALVRRIAYPSFHGNKATRAGLQLEDEALFDHTTKQGNGFSTWHCMLISSIVSYENNPVGLVEVKNVLHNKPLSLTEAAKKEKALCLEIRGDGVLVFSD